MQPDTRYQPAESNEAAGEAVELSPVYDVASSTLRFGFIVAAVLFVAGIVWSAIEREEIADHVTPIEQIPGQLADGTPMAAIMLSFLALMLTPVITVLRIGVVFWLLGDRRYAALSLSVVAILGTSLTLALLR
ncbi:hypothetical protein BH23CHL4_BH23CHL4_23270 [soil metagenome]